VVVSCLTLGGPQQRGWKQKTAAIDLGTSPQYPGGTKRWKTGGPCGLFYQNQIEYPVGSGGYEGAIFFLEFFFFCDTKKKKKSKSGVN